MFNFFPMLTTVLMCCLELHFNFSPFIFEPLRSYVNVLYIADLTEKILLFRSIKCPGQVISDASGAFF